MSLLPASTAIYRERRSSPNPPRGPLGPPPATPVARTLPLSGEGAPLQAGLTRGATVDEVRGDSLLPRRVRAKRRCPTFIRTAVTDHHPSYSDHIRCAFLAPRPVAIANRPPRDRLLAPGWLGCTARSRALLDGLDRGGAGTTVSDDVCDRVALGSRDAVQTLSRAIHLPTARRGYT